MTYRVPFVLASTAHGPMILSCIDFRPAEGGKVELGPGADLLFNAVYDRQQMAISNAFLQDRQRTHGNGVVAIDCGANIGAFTLEWARLMDGWGRVYAFEPQERVFYALAGNLAINNLFNARVFWKATPRLGEIPAEDAGGLVIGVVGCCGKPLMLPGSLRRRWLCRRSTRSIVRR